MQQEQAPPPPPPPALAVDAMVADVLSSGNTNTAGGEASRDVGAAVRDAAACWCLGFLFDVDFDVVAVVVRFDLIVSAGTPGSVDAEGPGGSTQRTVRVSFGLWLEAARSRGAEVGAFSFGVGGTRRVLKCLPWVWPGLVDVFTPTSRMASQCLRGDVHACFQLTLSPPTDRPHELTAFMCEIEYGLPSNRDPNPKPPTPREAIPFCSLFFLLVLENLCRLPLSRRQTDLAN